MKTFAMPAAQPLEPMALPARRAVKSPTLAFPRATGYRVGTVPTPAKRAAVQPVQGAQAQVSGSKYDARFIVATPRNLRGLFGNTRLRCGRENVDLERLDRGLLAWAADHDSQRLIGIVREVTFQRGQVHGAADYLSTPFALQIKAEIDFGSRNGCSPGFILEKYELSDGEDYEMDIDVTLWSPFEISSTATPLNPESVHYGLNGGSMTINDAIKPELLNTDDLPGLSLALGRRVLRDGKGSAAQRERLETFYLEFDAALSRGLPRDMAVQAAKTRMS